jgi:hypothetical protein
MLVTESGMLTDDSRVHESKADVPISLTESGTVTDDRLEHW